MIQQTNNTKSTKVLTKNDLKRIFWASGLNFFHDDRAFYPYPWGIYYLLRLHYVRKKSSSEYDYQLIRLSTGNDVAFTTPLNGMNYARFSVKTKSQGGIASISPNLLCDNVNEERLLIECWYGKSNYDKSKLGFFVVDPHVGGSAVTTDIGAFSYRMVITPKPGLFPAID